MAKGCARGLDRLADAHDFVGSKIIDHDDIVSLQCWHKTMFNVGKKHLSGHRSIEHHRCHHLVVTKRRDESDGLPSPLRHIINHSLATWSAAVEPHHVGTDCRLVDKDQMGGVKQALLSDPAPACPSHVRLLPFGCPQAFFEGDVMTLEEPPQRAPAAANSPFPQRCEQFLEGGIRLFFNKPQYRYPMFFQP